MLLHNLWDDSVTPREASPQILLQSLPRSIADVGSRPPIPFAESLTIARIASPVSVDKSFQPLFLDALRTYFQGRRRIVRQGDLFGVAIDGRKVRWIRKASTVDEETVEKRDGEDHKAAPDDLDIPALSLPAQGTAEDEVEASTEVVFFKVMSLVPDLAPLSIDAASASESELRFHSDAWTGAFGCIIDSELTKMVQTGVSNARVPDSAEWIGAQAAYPPIPSQDELSPLTAVDSPFAKIIGLLHATLFERSASFGLHLTALLKGARGCGKRSVTRWAAQELGIHLLELDCFDMVSDTDVRTEGMLRARFAKAAECAPCIVLLRNVEALARKAQAMETGQEPHLTSVLQSCIDSLRSRPAVEGTGKAPLPVAVFATTSDPDKCPVGVLGCFKHEVAFDAPNEAERLAMLHAAFRQSTLAPDVSLKNLATQTAALVAADLSNLAFRAQAAAINRLMGSTSRGASKMELTAAGIALTADDMEKALAKARSSYSESIGAPKIPNVTWDDVGGLASVKNDILDTIQLPLDHPELFSDGLKKRSGILLYGPPGTGKTLLAKAVATSCSLNFFSVKGPELLNMYIGESEANVRRVFQRARDAKPCVIFFDELDSVAPKRGNQGDSGGVMDRIVSQLLAELDGMAGGKEGTDVFVIGATNRPDLLDPALLRPGRYVEMS